jgi:hypothetical protein
LILCGPPLPGIRFLMRCVRARLQTWHLTGGWGRTLCSSVTCLPSRPGCWHARRGQLAGHAVDIGENHMVGPARRWAVALDAGGLVFVDSDQLAAE